MDAPISNVCSNVIVDYRTSKETIYNLEKLGYNVILTQKINTLYDSVDGHSDMQVFVADDKLISAKETYTYYKNIFGNKVICGSKCLAKAYPEDVLYNAACIGDFIICNKAHIAKEITEFAIEAKKTIIDVKQGYSKCSIGIIGKNAIVTADKRIAKKCANAGVDVLEIEAGHIKLEGMNYGFIGGTCGMIDENVLAFNGELKTHPQGDEIHKFCHRHNVDIVELKSGILEDIGSILIFNSDKE